MEATTIRNRLEFWGRLNQFVFLSGLAKALSSLGRRLGLSGLAAVDQAGGRPLLAFLEIGDGFAEIVVASGIDEG